MHDKTSSLGSAAVSPSGPCPYCASTDYHPLFRNVRDRLRVTEALWSYWRCVSCGSAVLLPAPSAVDLASFYPSCYTFGPDTAGNSAFRRFLAGCERRVYYDPIYQAQVRLVLRAIGAGGVRGKRVLDLGCGRGLRLLAFHRLGYAVHGLDLQPEAVAYLRGDLGIPATCHDLATGFAHLFAPESFHLITAFHLLEHLPDVLRVLADVSKLLTPGGWFVAGMPLVDSVQASVFRSAWHNVTEAPRHLSLPSQEGIRRVCRRAGFVNCTIRSESILNCAGLVGLSLFPHASTPHSYARPSLPGFLLRALAATASLLAVPWCVFDAFCLGRPAAGLLFAQKPSGEVSSYALAAPATRTTP